MKIINTFFLFFVLLGHQFQKSNQFEIRENIVTVNSNTTHVIRPRQVPQGTMKPAFGLNLLANAKGEFPSPSYVPLLNLLIMTFCLFRPIQPICKVILDISVGHVRPFSPEAIARGSHTQPSPTSVKTFVQFIQMAFSGKIQHYDYGPDKNLERYGSKTAPLYYLKDTTVPVGIFYGITDGLDVPKDVAQVASELPNCVYMRGVGDEKGGSHIDFFSAIDANEIFNKYVIDLCLKYT